MKKKNYMYLLYSNKSYKLVKSTVLLELQKLGLKKILIISNFFSSHIQKIDSQFHKISIFVFNTMCAKSGITF